MYLWGMQVNPSGTKGMTSHTSPRHPHRLPEGLSQRARLWSRLTQPSEQHCAFLTL